MTEKKSTDKCPTWAIRIIEKIREMEISLGNIPDSEEWRTIEDINLLETSPYKRTESGIVLTDDEVEYIFEKLVKNLSFEGFSANEIAGFINARVGYKGGPPYCSEEEVEEALGE